MSETLKHPDQERLQAFVEESLDGADAAVVASHLATCPRCRVEVEELQTLFGMLSSLAYHAPAAGFADRIMAGVRVRRPWFAVVEEWLERLAPKTARGWAFTSAMVALPAVATTALVWWLMTRPGVTVQGLWVISSDFASRALIGARGWAWARFADSTLAGWVTSTAELVAAAGRGGIGLGVVMFATLMAASIWILYQNLFRTEARRTDYASFVF
ncbi:MAG TPA: zf-HC2 domain-containing protein [Longimicrobiales bacterium]|nr:zf-HC2 domain-containing protein [Longimicrobiales bacterium]